MVRAFDFHHRDPRAKIKPVSFYIGGLQYNLAEREASKCDLLCANCHCEVEDVSRLG
jgi:hypothetical protein